LKRTIADIIKTERNAAGLTQDKLAYMAGISTRYFQDIESGNKQPSLNTLFKLCVSMDCHYSVIMEPVWKNWITENTDFPQD